MKLLSKKEIHQNKVEEVDAISLKLVGEVTKLEEKIKKLKASHKQEIARNIGESENILKEMSDRKSALLNEVLILEEKKKEALKPIDILRETLKLKEKELVEIESIIDKKTENNNILLESINIEIKKILLESNQLAELDEEIKKRKQNLEENEKSIEKDRRELKEIKKRESAEFKRKSMELMDKESDIALREKELEIKNNQIIKEKTILNNERKHLESQQMSLRAAFEELKKHA